ncbi:hypothetical protein KXW40_008973 [Aspergillus fumigatus]|nr:hypothetical protein KXX14_006611 [Aspergillus fumigatus]KAH2067266.1 hypothetical protein KXX03_000726 [Aspergillus fumigatus]KAH2468318.1 hypothetical protein KXW63_000484 [Aspergillus fumigatus]KAH2525266.1 hypothetical protein KXW40_008973 [Aspergillus fumigatus]KAH3249988.1 hypothetical protein KXW31_009182 [Aspergillus fumigatus]
MPRKKAADRVGPVKTRTRSGCKECRASRVRCDTQKPICSRCRDRGLVCSTELVLKWESEFLSRGLAFGRAGVWIKENEWCEYPPVESWGFVNSGVSTFENPHQVNVACDELNGLVVRARDRELVYGGVASPSSVVVADDGWIAREVSSPPASLSLFPNIPESKSHLFDYYLQQVCPRTTASSKLASPFASVILPFCLSASPTLFKAIQALGACHWSRFDPSYSVVGLRLKSEALRGLRHRLATEGSSTCSGDPEVLVIMMMLCLYEIVDNCDQRWTIHLKGAKELIRARRQEQGALARSRKAQDPVSAFAELFFAFQDVMGRTACGEEVLFGTDYWEDSEQKIDLWMGCSPELVSILSSITELSRTRRQLTSDSARAAFALRAASLGRRLETLVQEIDDEEDEMLKSAAELKRLAAVLYLHCALYGSSPSTPLVIGYVKRILRLVSELLDSRSLVSMTWPVFVAAVELDPARDELWSDPTTKTVVYGRSLVLRALAAMAESSVSNVARTRAVIIKVWQARDSDMLKGSPVDAADNHASCNDWEWTYLHLAAQWSGNDTPQANKHKTDSVTFYYRRFKLHDVSSNLIIERDLESRRAFKSTSMSNLTSSTPPSTLSHSLPAPPYASRLSEQLSQSKEQSEPSTDTDSTGDKASCLGTPLRPSQKSRSLSDAPKPVSASPSISGDTRPSSKDDNSITSTPETPRRSSMHCPNLSLNLPSKLAGSTSVPNRAPLSPKLDSSHIYGSPGSVLPRRSRGLDFSRACTNLHHSIIAESSPDSSPTVGGRGVTIPQRRGSPGSTSMGPFSTSGPADRTAISSSVSSVNMMESDTSSSEEDDEPMIGDRDDMMIASTPQANKMVGGPSPFAAGNISSPGNDWMGGYSQAAASLLSFQRARFRKGRSRHSSSSASGNSSKQSPGPLSPPVMKSIENPNGGYFGSKQGLGPRRESLSLGTRDLRLSDLSDEGESRHGHSSAGGSASEGGPLGVIRRAVTRRSSLLPKTKTFARIRAALMEESAPIDSEAKREAEVIRQVRESVPDVPHKSPSLDALSSLTPSVPGVNSEDGSTKPGPFTLDEPKFSDEAHRNSAGVEFWNTFDERYRTPPPSMRSLGPSAMSEDDIAMDITPSTTLGSSTAEFAKPYDRPGSSSSTPHASFTAMTEINRKRRREDDFDPNLFKRRAVSPSMSVQSSPVMPNSPAVKDTGHNIWGPPPKSNLGSLFPERPNGEHPARNTSNTSHSGQPLKRVGLQGMTEANDGFMNMSIE